MNQQIDIPGVGVVEFPASMSDADIEKAAAKLHADAMQAAPKEPSTNSALMMAAAGKAFPAASQALTAIAQSPNAPKIGATIGRVIGGVTPIITGAVEGGPVGALVGVSAASKGAWAGGKTGWFTTKLLQKAASPVAAAASAVAPYAQTLSTLSGAQGVNDLAQMAEPKRRDIGFLGIGFTSPEDDLHALSAAISKGANPAQAAAQIAHGNPQRFGQLMTAYMQSRQVR